MLALLIILVALLIIALAIGHYLAAHVGPRYPLAPRQPDNTAGILRDTGDEVDQTVFPRCTDRPA